MVKSSLENVIVVEEKCCFLNGQAAQADNVACVGGLGNGEFAIVAHGGDPARGERITLLIDWSATTDCRAYSGPEEPRDKGRVAERFVSAGLQGWDRLKARAV